MNVIKWEIKMNCVDVLSNLQWKKSSVKFKYIIVFIIYWILYNKFCFNIINNIILKANYLMKERKILIIKTYNLEMKLKKKEGIRKIRFWFIYL